MKLTLHPNSYDWKFLPVAGSTFTDSGSASVHDAPPGQNSAPVAVADCVFDAAEHREGRARAGCARERYGCRQRPPDGCARVGRLARNALVVPGRWIHVHAHLRLHGRRQLHLQGQRRDRGLEHRHGVDHGHGFRDVLRRQDERRLLGRRAGYAGAAVLHDRQGRVRCDGGQDRPVLAGTYAETVNGPNSGTAGNPITYSAAPGVMVTGNGTATGNAFRISTKSYITVDGFTVSGTVDYGIYVASSNHITIANNHVTLSGSPVSGGVRAGIYLNATTDSTVSGNTSDHNSQDGIRLTNGCTGVTVRDNVAFANAEQWERNATGIHVNGSSANTIIHNTTYANEDSGLQFYVNAHDNLVIGNLSYGNGDHGIDNNASPNNVIVGNSVQGNHTAGINLEGASAPGSGGATLANNIAVDNGINPVTGQKSNIRVDSQSLTGTTLDYDLVFLTAANGGTVEIIWGATSYTSLAFFKTGVPGQEVHGLQADPLWIGPAAPAGRPPAVTVGDYHLGAGSPAIDSANSGAPNESATDLDGHARVDDPATTDTGAGARTYDDRGALEFVPTSGNHPPVAVADSYSTPQDTTLTVAAPGVLGNDTDADLNPLTAIKVTDPAHGTLTLGSNGSIGYVPTAGYSGPDSFTYKANDGTADSNTVTVSLTVTAAPNNMALQLNGSSQYATLGGSSDLRSATFTVELWFKRTGAGVGTSTGTGGIASAIPLIAKGRAEGETAAQDINYFLGIDATSGKLVADFEEGAGGSSPSANHPITGTTAIPIGTRLASRRGDLQRSGLESLSRWRAGRDACGQSAGQRRHHLAHRSRQCVDHDRYGGRVLRRRRRRGADLELGADAGADPGDQGHGDHGTAVRPARCLEPERGNGQQPGRPFRQRQDRRSSGVSRLGGRLRPARRQRRAGRADAECASERRHRGWSFADARHRRLRSRLRPADGHLLRASARRAATSPRSPSTPASPRARTTPRAGPASAPARPSSGT